MSLVRVMRIAATELFVAVAERVEQLGANALFAGLVFLLPCRDCGTHCRRGGFALR